MEGRLHLIEKLDHVFRLKDGSGLWASGYWELGDAERVNVRRLYLHQTKSDLSYWGGDVQRVLPAEQFADMARKHATEPSGRWVLVVLPDPAAKGVAWEGARHSMAYKSMV